MAYPIPGAKQSLPERDCAQVFIVWPNGGKGVRSGVALDVPINAVPSQLWPSGLHILDGLRQQHRVGLYQYLIGAVNVRFQRAATCFAGPASEWVIQPVEPEIIVQRELARKNARLRAPGLTGRASRPPREGVSPRQGAGSRS